MRNTAEHLASNPGDVEEKDIFLYGTIAKISGVQGRRPGELALVVEGSRRFKVERFVKSKPYVECEVTPLAEESECNSLDSLLFALMNTDIPY